ncbi:hypothetical protein DSM110093_02921 [Sulfitobacter sp. DSM 110093]|nr:hypothetical protein DSM110093_02921 [Sulfitobacter sp. DSM 110093]
MSAECGAVATFVISKPSANFAQRFAFPEVDTLVSRIGSTCSLVWTG